MQKKETIGEFLRFGITGVISTAVHYAIYWVLQHWVNVNVAYTVGYVLSFLMNYWMTAHFTFKERTSGKNAVGFGGAHLVNYCLHIVLLNFFLWLGLSRELAPLGVYAIAIPTNFVLVRYVFKHVSVTPVMFARDKSQMCNNLLQYAHVYAWGREHGRKVVSMRFSYKYRYFHICHTSLTGFGWYLLAKYAAALRLLPTASFKDSDCDREALERKMLAHPHIVVSGWHVRYYDLFLKYRQEICELFTLDPQFTAPVKAKMNDTGIRLGVHIRRGDYAQWQGGRYCFDDDVYIRHINRFAAMHEGEEVHVYLSTNDPSVDAGHYQQHCPAAVIHHLQGSAPEDLFMLSECHYLIGPPSTFSLVAAMYKDLPLYRMDSPEAERMTAADFHLFDYWFRRIL